jgi:hypothetical protein
LEQHVPLYWHRSSGIECELSTHFATVRARESSGRDGALVEGLI